MADPAPVDADREAAQRAQALLETQAKAAVDRFRAEYDALVKRTGYGWAAVPMADVGADGITRHYAALTPRRVQPSGGE